MPDRRKRLCRYDSPVVKYTNLRWSQRCYQDQGVRDQDRDQDQGGRDQDQDQDLKKVVLIGLETKTRVRDMYAMLLYKSSKS